MLLKTPATHRRSTVVLSLVDRLALQHRHQVWPFRRYSRLLQLLPRLRNRLCSLHRPCNPHHPHSHRLHRHLLQLR